MTLVVRQIEAGDVSECDRILTGLPDWFGLEESNREYIAGLMSRASAVAESDGRVVGFVSLERHNPASAEVHVLAVGRELHRSGIGTRLIDWTQQWCEGEGIRWLHVKTRGPSTPDPGYERTRHFYLAHGFEPLFETLDLWGPEDAALVLVKQLGGDAATA